MSTDDVVTVNGTPRSLAAARPESNALDWLRAIGLTGAKEGCAEGECGACSVLLARPGIEAETEWVALNSCLLPAASLAGQEVVTSEGLGTPADLHPVQSELAVRGGSQCGYCTPGFVCSMAAEFYRPGREDFDHHALSGNLCRCTGYRPIVEAAEALGAPDQADPLLRRTTSAAPAASPTRAEGWIRPAHLAEALEALAEPGAVAVAGSTDLGVEANLRGHRPALRVAIDRLDELRGLVVGEESVQIGAALTLSEVERLLAGRVPLLAEVFPQFASRLIRNGATIGGNLGTGSPIGDLAPALLALDASVVLVSAEGERTVVLADYFTGYRQSVRRSDELIALVRIPRPLAPDVAFHKIAKRRFDDISSVAVAHAIEVREGTVSRAAIGLGGVAATPIRASEAERLLVGASWSPEGVAAAADALADAGTPIDDHRASAAYRRAMLGQSLRRLVASS
ncbi:xanthine dehydrogenase small subunit [Nocardioides sp. Root190]|uniref:xanthine dehydrogenase small subunit n=1 Tax=Nocardioides sp. Root190 TaxID=1736488 RepID=UPI00070114F0|nr:FAD binding domain-containing protein [Nocardioides sp. Root190]KRB76932.1 xanthine dehydrogenase small subunit [Nocardioides sp. Root190]